MRGKIAAPTPNEVLSTDARPGNFAQYPQLAFLNGETAMPDKSIPDEDNRSSGKLGPESDAKGQSEKHHKGGTNDGVSSANPRVISGNDDGDATFPHKREK
ncbi:hypothetical protein [Mesorhizobium sp. M0895]|uniref:hypothetical protein n=1 Tax=Mesorhizobium sp. M0895 TaxID=2957019 RepID=UPI00333DE92F